MRKIKSNSVIKNLLINYISKMYENEARYDEKYLKMEYKWLQDNNQIHLLFPVKYDN